MCDCPCTHQQLAWSALKIQKQVSSEAELAALGAKFAPEIKRVQLVCLRGELGSGKTTFARGLIQALLPSSAVQSPTFNLVIPYVIDDWVIYHFDFYRIDNSEELELFGLRDYFHEHSVSLVEWPEKAEDFLPRPDIDVIIQKVKHGRELQIFSYTDNGATMLRAL